ncbi:MAG: YkgJ family cysteine cluster protein [archaeon]|jgi:Fe-S-cluster containining protein
MNKQPKLSKKEESDSCLACGECCKKYWITVLPNESDKISKELGISKKEFLEKNCVLHVKLFPKSTPGVLTFPSTFFPKRIFDLLKKEFGNFPESFFIVPQVVLKREEKITFSFKEKKSKQEKRLACSFIDATNACSIYPVRPAPCRLFPFIAVSGFREQYPFCELFSKTFKDYSIESKIYYAKVQGYFKEVNDKTFTKLWKSPPKKGIFYLQDKYLGEINLSELEEMMPKKE